MTKQEYKKQYYLKNKEKILESGRLNYIQNRDKIKNSARQYWLKNKEKVSANSRAYYYLNREKYLQARRDYYRNNLQKEKQNRKKYWESNREKMTTRCKRYSQNHRSEISTGELSRYRNDLVFRLRKNLRNRIRQALKKNQKSGSAVRDLGCTIDQLKQHLESRFNLGMTWDNYGQWHIDHIKPLASFNLTDREQFLRACHYTNLQPLWAKDNREKWDRE